MSTQNAEEEFKVNHKAVIVLLILLALLLIFWTETLGSSKAEADVVEWIRVIDDQTALYANPSTIKTVCLLEKSYYLRVIETTSDFFYVRLMEGTTKFPSISGYVKKEEVLLLYDAPTLPVYPTETITVKQSNAHIYFSPLQTSTVLIVATNTQSMSYYGKISQNGILWYYVYFGGSFGYVDSSYVTAPQIPLHPVALPAVAPPDDDPIDDNPPTQPPSDNPVTVGEVIMILFVILLSAGLGFALFLPNKTRQK